MLSIPLDELGKSDLTQSPSRREICAEHCANWGVYSFSPYDTAALTVSYGMYLPFGLRNVLRALEKAVRQAALLRVNPTLISHTRGG